MKTLKLIAFKFIFFLFFFNQIVFSKSLPPGTGIGDVPVNILLLLDTSQSMQTKPLTGEGIDNPESIVLLNDDRVLVGQSPGVEKYNTIEKIKDVTFNDNKKIFVGEPKDDCQLDGVQNTNIGRAVSMDVSLKVKGMLDKEVIYIAADAQQKVVLIKANGDCIEVIDRVDLGIVNTAHSTDKRKPVGLNIRTIDGEDHLLITGREEWCKVEKNKSKCKTKGPHLPYVYSKNLTTGDSKVCSNTGKFWFLNFAQSITMNKDHLFVVERDQIFRIPLEKKGNVYCPSQDTHDHAFTTDNSPINAATAIDVDPQNSNVIYVASSASSTLQKLIISNNNNKKLTEKIVIGNGSSDCNATRNAATTDIESVSICKPLSIFVGNDRLWLGGEKASIQEFNIEDDDNISWIQEMGSTKLTRLGGAIKAIEAVVDDSSLTEGANFGFGIWNAGEQICSGKKASFLWEKGCELACGKELTYKGKKTHQRPKTCHYYKNWIKLESLSSSDKKKYPFGRSSLCNDNSCINVGIDEKTSENIKYHLKLIKPRYGTDARAFSQLAYKYFTENQLNIVDDDIPCQLNYAIVISDGKWVRHDYALGKIKDLRHEKGVKTLVVAYGDLAVNEDTLPTFNEMALAGTCDPGSDTAGECRGVIEAPTPGILLTKLKTEIQRIIASRLSFTAPSITASIQEGGDLYQAQFEYMRDGEWEGHLVKKQVAENGSVEDDIDWDSADKIKEQAKLNQRKIWTVLPSKNYTTDYNNFITDNSVEINVLFETLGEPVADFHNSTSRCKGEMGTDGENVKDGNLDDINGLIDFVRGKDYFGYSGCKNLSKVRDHVLGDIYHSQMVEVGPPNASVFFTRNNQEAYFRSTKNYASFARTHSNRERILYVGANDGMLHAIRATSSVGTAGEELWAFVPPFIAGKLPTMINEALDGIGLNNTKGGSVSIFTVDGSPVVHDMYIRGLREDGTYQGVGEKSWHTILFIPYGRGGKGFSVLDITRPEKPLHMFSVYNDTRNQVVLVADKDGTIAPHNYQSGSLSMGDALEAERSRTNFEIAKREDSDGDTTEIDKIAKCQTNADSTTGSFHVNGSNSCFTGKTWTFDFKAPEEIFSDFSKLSVIASNETLEDIQVKVKNISKDGPYTKIEFDTNFAYSYSESDLTELPTESTFTIRWDTAGTGEKEFDYSTLGETWAAPRIVRIAQSDKVSEDQYVAVLAGGFGTDGHIGSSLFLIDLNDTETNYGKIYGADENNGPIKIIDLEQDPNVANAITGDPVVVTADTFKGVSWRGAMVYLADIEGKITKINLTNDKDANLYDQTTLFSLNTSRENGRYMYFGMDAAYGNDTKNLWLFGGTGDFTKIATRSKGMDNVLFGIRDRHFPKFVHLNGINVGLETKTDSETNALIANDEFVKAATDGALAARHIDQSNYCVNTADGDLSSECPGQEYDAWIFKLDKPSDKSLDVEPKEEGRKNKDRKASASPTVFGGNVYYPIYEPPTGSSICNVGKAFVCSADDECGINNSKEIDYVSKSVGSDSEYKEEVGCYYLQHGILSKLVVFGDTLYGNVTTESTEQKDTLVSFLANEGELSLYRGSWRENY